jgi:hypothetical protein
MVEYFYTVDLGEVHGRKLERLAEKAGFDDMEAFAALLLAYAVDQAGAWDAETLKRAIRQSREVPARATERLIFGTPDDSGEGHSL